MCIPASIRACSKSSTDVVHEQHQDNSDNTLNQRVRHGPADGLPGSTPVCFWTGQSSMLSVCALGDEPCVPPATTNWVCMCGGSILKQSVLEMCLTYRSQCRATFGLQRPNRKPLKRILG